MISTLLVSFLISIIIVLVYRSVNSSDEENVNKSNIMYSNIIVFVISFIVSFLIQYFLSNHSSKGSKGSNKFYKLINGGDKAIKGTPDPYDGLIDEIDTGEVPF